VINQVVFRTPEPGIFTCFLNVAPKCLYNEPAGSYFYAAPLRGHIQISFKMKNLLYLPLWVLLAAAVYACNQPSTPPGPAHGKVPDEMNPREAKAAIAEWDSLRKVVVNYLDSTGSPEDTIYIAKGFNIPFDDIQDLMDNVGDKSQLFAMLAIEKDSAGNPYLSLIFQAPDTSKKQTIRYYDFTKPCPNNCPD
jgi:hypothetical protein